MRSLPTSHEGAARGADYQNRDGYVKERFPSPRNRRGGKTGAAPETGAQADDQFFEKLPSTLVAIETCASSHNWARLLTSLGHEVRLIAPQLVKPYVTRGNNDTADAEALCDAAGGPTMRFVPAKAVDEQAALMLVGMRTRLIRKRTQLANAIRGMRLNSGLPQRQVCVGLSHC